jgi:hypothetical protein
MNTRVKLGVAAFAGLGLLALSTAKRLGSDGLERGRALLAH